MTEGALRSAGGVIINSSSAHYVLALAETFGVRPSYLFDRRGRKLLVISREAIEILRDETLSAVATRACTYL